MVLYFLGSILFTAFGLFLFFKPELFWKITEQWKSYSADEPSDFYKISTKFGGLLFVVFGVVTLILPFLIE